MPLKRQLRYQKQCRDTWKENAAKKQKKIREQDQVIRNLTLSREKWCKRATTAEQQLQEARLRIQELERQLADSESFESSESNNEDDDDPPLPIPHHSYDTSTISLAVQQFIQTEHSYRGINPFGELIINN